MTESAHWRTCWYPILAFLIALCPPGAAAGEAAEECSAVHAAYDIGSSTTRVKVARVDLCEGRIAEVLLEESRSVGYQEDLARGEGDLSEGVREAGLAALEELQAAAAEHEPTSQIGVATAAFRESGNGERFVAWLSERTGIELEIISDRREAALGFQAAVANAQADPRRAVVWDIGGGSMQVVALDSNKEAGRDRPEDEHGGVNPAYFYHEGETASVRFRDSIIRDLQGRDLRETRSPNPISPELGRKALALARELAGELPGELAAHLVRPETVVLGIGGVHYYSIPGQLDSGDQPYTREQVAAMLRERIGQSDEEIGGDFADTEVSNLILVLGFMQAWGIDEIQPTRAAMSDGLLLEQAAMSQGDE